MRIDWIVAILVFLILTTWALAAYFSILNVSTFSDMESAISYSDEIAGNLKAAIFTMAANLSSNQTLTNSSIRGLMTWQGGMSNSTVVSQGGMVLPCLLSNDSVYWKANVTAGSNIFAIEYSDAEGPPRCNGSFETNGSGSTKLWPAENGRILSRQKTYSFCTLFNTSSDYRNQMRYGGGFDLNILADMNGTVISCGSNIPRSGKTVFSFRYLGAMMEGGSADIYVRLWK